MPESRAATARTGPGPRDLQVCQDFCSHQSPQVSLLPTGQRGCLHPAKRQHTSKAWASITPTPLLPLCLCEPHRGRGGRLAPSGSALCTVARASHSDDRISCETHYRARVRLFWARIRHPRTIAPQKGGDGASRHKFHENGKYVPFSVGAAPGGAQILDNTGVNKPSPAVETTR